MTSGIIGAIVAIVLLFGGGVGGWFLRGEVAPKTNIQNINNDTTVNQRQEMRTSVMQGQITVIVDGPLTNTVVSVLVRDLTNVVVTGVTNTNNSLSITNFGKND